MVLVVGYLSCLGEWKEATFVGMGHPSVVHPRHKTLRLMKSQLVQGRLRLCALGPSDAPFDADERTERSLPTICNSNGRPSWMKSSLASLYYI